MIKEINRNPMLSFKHTEHNLELLDRAAKDVHVEYTKPSADFIVCSDCIIYGSQSLGLSKDWTYKVPPEHACTLCGETFPPGE